MMKNFRIINIGLVVAVLSLATVMLQGCKEDEDSPIVDTLAEQRDEVIGRLTGATWSVSSVKVDNFDQDDLFEGLTISFENGAFTAQNGGEVWPATGTWEFVSEESTIIVRDDATVVNIVTLNASMLVLSLNWTEDTIGLGRTESVSGEHVFTFVKQ